jgi:hypothetical protein
MARQAAKVTVVHRKKDLTPHTMPPIAPDHTNDQETAPSIAPNPSQNPAPNTAPAPGSSPEEKTLKDLE